MNQQRTGDYLQVKTFKFPLYTRLKNPTECSESKGTKGSYSILSKIQKIKEFKSDYMNPKAAGSENLVFKAQKGVFYKNFHEKDQQKLIRPVSASFFSQKIENKRKPAHFRSVLILKNLNFSNLLTTDSQTTKNPSKNSKGWLFYDVGLISTGLKSINSEKNLNKSGSLDNIRPKVRVQAWIPQPVILNKNSHTKE